MHLLSTVPLQSKTFISSLWGGNWDFFSQGEGTASLFYLLSEYLLCGTACPSGLPSVTTKGFLCQHLLFLEPEGFKDPQAMFHLLVLWNISEFYQSV